MVLGISIHKIWGQPEVSISSDSSSSRGPDSSRSLHDRLTTLMRGVVVVSETSTVSTQGPAEEERVDASTRLSIVDLHSRLALADNHGGADSDEQDSGEHAEESRAELGERDLAVPSAGSTLHDSGGCKPCHYARTKSGCINGEACPFCHLDHPKRLRPRPSKTKRLKCKQLVGMLEDVYSTDPCQFDQEVARLSTKGDYLRSVVRSKVRSMHVEADLPSAALMPLPAGLLSL